MRRSSRSKAVIGLFAIALLFLVGFFWKQQINPDQPSSERFSSVKQREVWTSQLQTESSERPRVQFHSFGHLLAVGGKFPVRDLSPGTVVDWLKSHGQMLGLPPDAELQVQTSSIERQTQTTSIASSIDRQPQINSFDPRLNSLIFQVKVNGIPFIGLPIRVEVDPASIFIKSVVNGFSPAIMGFGRLAALGEEAAWAAMERAANTTITRVSATESWFDPDWATYRRAGTKEVHWRLEGIDAFGLRRYAYVRSSDERISYLNSDQIVFQLRQKHFEQLADRDNVYWDSGPPPQECTPSASCTQQNLTDSRIIRDAFDKVVDLWYRLSSDPAVSFESHQWPYIPDWSYTGPRKSPLDNHNQMIQVILGTNGCNSFPCRELGKYKFPSAWLEQDNYAVVGHEYGHAILTELKNMIDTPGEQAATAQFTEAMADLIGIVSNYKIRLEQYEVASPFQIGKIVWFPTYPDRDYRLDDIIQWELKTGRCPWAKNAIRDRLGHAFYKTFREVQLDVHPPIKILEKQDDGTYKLIVNPEYLRLFRAWWLVIFTLFRDTPEMPTHEDLLAQTMYSSTVFVNFEWRIQLKLRQQMLDLHLDVDRSNMAELPLNPAGKEPLVCPSRP